MNVDGLKDRNWMVIRMKLDVSRFKWTVPKSKSGRHQVSKLDGYFEVCILSSVFKHFSKGLKMITGLSIT